MKRPLLLAGAIVATVITSIILLSLTINFFILLEFSYLYTAVFYLLYLVVIAIVVLALIFNIEAIRSFKYSKTSFKYQKPFNITAVVFNFIIITLYFISFLFVYPTNVISLLVALSLLTGNILILVDLGREKNRVDIEKKLLKSKKDDSEEIKEDVFSDEIVEEVKEPKKEEIKITKSENSLLTLESKLLKLNEMKEQGLIDQDEYNELKKSYIKDEIKK